MRIFVTGASGWIGSHVVPELQEAGHQVLGLARSDASALALQSAGVQVVRGSLDEPDALRAAAQSADGVIHLAFRHDLAFAGQMPAAVQVDLATIAAFGEALEGSDKPFVLASGLLGLSPGRVSTEQDRRPDAQQDADAGVESSEFTGDRHRNALATLELADRGVRAVVVRLPPTCHGEGDKGFVPTLIAKARDTGSAGYLGDGSNRWPAGHVLDVARLFRLAAEKAPAGTVLHANTEEGVPAREIAEAIGRHLEVPVAQVPDAEAQDKLGWIAGPFSLDSPASSSATQELLGWQPSHPDLIADLDQGHYFRRQ